LFTPKVKRLSVLLLLVAGMALPVGADEPTPAPAPKSLTGRLLDKAKSFIGTPYRLGGSTPKAFDCSGFVSYVFKQAGVELPRSSVTQSKVGETVDLDEAQPGDLLFFKTRGQKNRVSHVGIYLGDGQFIHASSKGTKQHRTVRISDMEGQYYMKRLATVRRILVPGSAVMEEALKYLGADVETDAAEKPAQEPTPGDEASR